MVKIKDICMKYKAKQMMDSSHVREQNLPFGEAFQD